MPFGDAVTLISENEIHMYCADGKTYPSVTTILDIVAYSKPLMYWANNLGFRRLRYEEELEKAATQGKYVHEINQCLVDPDHGVMPVIRDPLTDYRVRKRVGNFNAKLKEHSGHWKTIYSEQKFVSHTYEIGGTMDWYTQWYDETILFDYKTSSAVRDKHILQLGGYYLILCDHDLPMDRAGIILCKEDRCIFNIFEKSDIEKAADVFLSIYEYYKKHRLIEEVMSHGPQRL